MAVAPAVVSREPDSELCSCVLSALTHTLPPYTPSPPAPSYSDHPACGERSLHYAAGGRFRPRNPASTFVKQFAKATVVLRGQEPNVRTPWYGRDEVISGFVTFENACRVSQVDILVEGKLDIMMAEGISKVTTLVNSSSTLWKRTSPNDSCPEQVEFAFSLPESYQSGDATYSLPPSFQEQDLGGAFNSIRSSYRIRVTVTKTPKNRFSFEKTEHLFLSFDYLPRSRSSDPTTTLPGCVANIKQLPNEWYQVTSIVPVEPQPHLEPVFSNLFVPAARVYPLTDPIPFHVETSGRRESLRALLSTNQPESPPTSPISPSRPLSLVNGKTISCLQKCEPKEYLSWTGTLKPSPDVKTGGFETEFVKVADYVALAIGDSEVPWKDITNSVGIKLVTDSWEDPEPELALHDVLL
ncbi:hypothetical protein H1R20_g13403, partial [Candolleomyces eurysporus]